MTKHSAYTLKALESLAQALKHSGNVIPADPGLLEAMIREELNLSGPVGAALINAVIETANKARQASTIPRTSSLDDEVFEAIIRIYNGLFAEWIFDAMSVFSPALYELALNDADFRNALALLALSKGFDPVGSDFYGIWFVDVIFEIAVERIPPKWLQVWATLRNNLPRSRHLDS